MVFMIELVFLWIEFWSYLFLADTISFEALIYFGGGEKNTIFLPSMSVEYYVKYRDFVEEMR